MTTESILDRILTLSMPEQANVCRLFAYDDTQNRIYYGIDSEGNPIFTIQSFHPMMRQQLQSTRKLVLSSNLKCQAFIGDVPIEMTVHMLTCLSRIYEEQIAFIRLTKAFIPHFTNDKPHIANELFSALVNLFSRSGQSSEAELQGLYAELCVILFFDREGINLCNYWQKQEKMNFDFSISNSKRIEVKSTVRAERIHHFRHEQLLSDLYDIIIVSLLLRKDDAGTSLFSLINQVRSAHAEDFDSLLYIDRLIKNISEDDLRRVRYDDEYTKEHLRFYPAAKIPRFDEVQPDGVTHTEYDSDLSASECVLYDDFVSWMNIGGTESV